MLWILKNTFSFDVWLFFYATCSTTAINSNSPTCLHFFHWFPAIFKEAFQQATESGRELADFTQRWAFRGLQTAWKCDHSAVVLSKSINRSYAPHSNRTCPLAKEQPAPSVPFCFSLTLDASAIEPLSGQAFALLNGKKSTEMFHLKSRGLVN